MTRCPDIRQVSFNSTHPLDQRRSCGIEDLSSTAKCQSETYSWREAHFDRTVATMDIYASTSNYITKMVSTGDAQSSGGAAKMKILLMDRDTVGAQQFKDIAEARSNDPNRCPSCPPQPLSPLCSTTPCTSQTDSTIKSVKRCDISSVWHSYDLLQTAYSF